VRVLFYIGDEAWSGSARAFVAAARGLTSRGHLSTIACKSGSPVERVATAAGLDIAVIDPETGTAGGTWWLRKVLQERFIEVVFVHREREQFIVSSAMRLAERGAVIRRVPPFCTFSMHRGGRFALNLAATGLVFSTEHDLKVAEIAELPIPSTVAPIGVDAASYDALRPAPRASIGAPAQGLLIVCSYEPTARIRVATVLRTLALLAPRHPELHVAIIGRGSLDDDLRMHAAALGVNSLVSCVGEREDDLAVLRAADVGWVVSQDDDAAFAFLDFMAMRIPVLGERGILAQHYVADGITGVLLEPGDPSFTASAVAAFLGHEENRVAMGNAGRVRVQRDFPEAQMIDGFERAAEAAADRTKWAAR
jgi:glycosyltransferase involved in cell wall biosynthesis